MVNDIPVRHFEDSQPPWAAYYLETRNQREDCTYDNVDSLRREFIDADTEKQMDHFLERHGLWPGYKDLYGDTDTTTGEYIPNLDLCLNDMLTMRSILETVLKVKGLIDNNAATLENLAECGIVLTDTSKEEYLFSSYYYTEKESHRNELQNHGVDMTAQDVQFFHFSIESGLIKYFEEYNEELVCHSWYAEFLSERYSGLTVFFSLHDEGVIYFQYPVALIFEERGVIPLDKCAPIAAQVFIDAVISAHLRSVSILSVNSQELIICQDFTDTIWHSLFDAFRGGRVGRCDWCGKPYISKMERGKPRRYCSEKCSKRAQRGGIANKRKKSSDTPQA
jgi:hypothetical protein